MNLIKSEIEEIDSAIETGVNDLSWHSESKLHGMGRILLENYNTIKIIIILLYLDIKEYLAKLREPVECLQIRMQKTQDNLREIERITSTWVKQPLFERKDGKKDSVLCLSEGPSRVTKRYAEIEIASNTVQR